MKKNIRAASVLLAIAVMAGALSPLAVKATSTNENSSSYMNLNIEQLQAMIAKMQARLEELKKKSVQCFVSDSALSLGDGEGSDTADVRRLQDFLREKGHYSYKSTGWFGKLTRAALVAFQKANGLNQSGEFDSATKEKAHSLTCLTLAKKVVEQKKPETKKYDDKEEAKKSGKVSSISMTVNGSTVKWTTNGYSQNGFKIVWSKNAAPTYPTREGDSYIYLSDPSASTATLDAFSGSGEYHVRVCEYLGGACGVYSNETTTNL